MAEKARIQIQANGPYVVTGAVPLCEMEPVQTYNGEPIAWHRLRDLGEPQAAYALCRCGQSSNKPYCDGTHATVAFDGEETADRSPGVTRQKQVQGDGIVVTDDTSLCEHAGFCGTRTTNVWKMAEQSADPDVRAQMIGMIQRCPSGRLAYAIPPNAMPRRRRCRRSWPSLRAARCGCGGGIPVESADGHVWEAQNRRTLCRCGGSKNKPFCDGTHHDRHFDER